MELSKIKLIISEIDGIITEHLVAYGEMNITMFKQFNMKDFEAINLLKKDWSFAFLSADAAINSSLCRKRSIPFYYAERSKKEVCGHLIQRFSLTPDDVLYIGSSYSDIDCMRLSGFSMCPEDAVSAVKNTADHVIPVFGGTGVLCYVYELLLANKSRSD
jgi:3-deoxy-D-manno-octulosonate 8-phosphate phosphatase (KDO 8-P phosphatase)